jgi:hypothetical protein
MTKTRTVTLPTIINSDCVAVLRNCLHKSIVIIELALFNIDVRELIKAAILKGAEGGMFWFYIQAIRSFLIPPMCVLFILGLFWKRLTEQVSLIILKEKFGGTEGVVRMRKSKTDKQYNDQKIKFDKKKQWFIKHYTENKRLCNTYLYLFTYSSAQYDFHVR